MKHCLVQTPLGTLYVGMQDDAIHRISFSPLAEDTCPTPEIIKRAFRAYFNNPGEVIQLPLHLTGTPFQRRVWETLRNIPAGTPWTYGELAAHLGSHPRAVGQALKRNPCLIAIPCHRVVAKTGLGGFAGKTSGTLPDIKAWLLQHEQRDTA